ncbi:MAG TPA: class I SAM-dependent methyltransferase [Opitutaceae bacterium]|nr:class I SAM-dependent methyltransferase [Opitutaceae bacterium]
MFSGAPSIPDIPGDYQHRALHHGPQSQRRWHRQKLEIVLEAAARRPFDSALDAGCGSAIVSAQLARAYPDAEVLGLDLSRGAVEFCRRTYGAQRNLAFLTADLTQPDLKLDRAFDFIFSTEVIEHLQPDQVAQYLRNLHRFGRPGCRYFLSTPDYSTCWPAVEWTLDLLRLTPRMRGHQHLTLFTPGRLRRALEHAGFRLDGMYGFCGFGPLLGSVSSALATRLESWERRRGRGLLIGCEFSKC